MQRKENWQSEKFGGLKLFVVTRHTKTKKLEIEAKQLGADIKADHLQGTWASGRLKTTSLVSHQDSMYYGFW